MEWFKKQPLWAKVLWIFLALGALSCILDNPFEAGSFGNRILFDTVPEILEKLSDFFEGLVGIGEADPQ